MSAKTLELQQLAQQRSGVDAPTPVSNATKLRRLAARQDGAARKMTRRGKLEEMPATDSAYDGVAADRLQRKPTKAGLRCTKCGKRARASTSKVQPDGTLVHTAVTNVGPCGGLIEPTEGDTPPLGAQEGVAEARHATRPPQAGPALPRAAEGQEGGEAPVGGLRLVGRGGPGARRRPRGSRRAAQHRQPHQHLAHRQASPPRGELA